MQSIIDITPILEDGAEVDAMTKAFCNILQDLHKQGFDGHNMAIALGHAFLMYCENIGLDGETLIQDINGFK